MHRHNPFKLRTSSPQSISPPTRVNDPAAQLISKTSINDSLHRSESIINPLDSNNDDDIDQQKGKKNNKKKANNNNNNRNNNQNNKKKPELDEQETENDDENNDTEKENLSISLDDVFPSSPTPTILPPPGIPISSSQKNKSPIIKNSPPKPITEDINNNGKQKNVIVPSLPPLEASAEASIDAGSYETDDSMDTEPTGFGQKPSNQNEFDKLQQKLLSPLIKQSPFPPPPPPPSTAPLSTPRLYDIASTPLDQKEKEKEMKQNEKNRNDNETNDNDDQGKMETDTNNDQDTESEKQEASSVDGLLLQMQSSRRTSNRISPKNCQPSLSKTPQYKKKPEEKKQSNKKKKSAVDKTKTTRKRKIIEDEQQEEEQQQEVLLTEVEQENENDANDNKDKDGDDIMEQDLSEPTHPSTKPSPPILPPVLPYKKHQPKLSLITNTIDKQEKQIKDSDKEKEKEAKKKKSDEEKEEEEAEKDTMDIDEEKPKKKKLSKVEKEKEEKAESKKPAAPEKKSEKITKKKSTNDENEAEEAVIDRAEEQEDNRWKKKKPSIAEKEKGKPSKKTEIEKEKEKPSKKLPKETKKTAEKEEEEEEEENIDKEEEASVKTPIKQKPSAKEINLKSKKSLSNNNTIDDNIDTTDTIRSSQPSSPQSLATRKIFSRCYFLFTGKIDNDTKLKLKERIEARGGEVLDDKLKWIGGMTENDKKKMYRQQIELLKVIDAGFYHNLNDNNNNDNNGDSNDLTTQLFVIADHNVTTIKYLLSLTLGLPALLPTWISDSDSKGHKIIPCNDDYLLPFGQSFFTKKLWTIIPKKEAKKLYDDDKKKQRGEEIYQRVKHLSIIPPDRRILYGNICLIITDKPQTYYELSLLCRLAGGRVIEEKIFRKELEKLKESNKLLTDKKKAYIISDRPDQLVPPSLQLLEASTEDPYHTLRILSMRPIEEALFELKRVDSIAQRLRDHCKDIKDTNLSHSSSSSASTTPSTTEKDNHSSAASSSSIEKHKGKKASSDSESKSVNRKLDFNKKDEEDNNDNNQMDEEKQEEEEEDETKTNKSTKKGTEKKLKRKQPDPEQEEEGEKENDNEKETEEKENDNDDDDKPIVHRKKKSKTTKIDVSDRQEKEEEEEGEHEEEEEEQGMVEEEGSEYEEEAVNEENDDDDQSNKPSKIQKKKSSKPSKSSNKKSSKKNRIIRRVPNKPRKEEDDLNYPHP